jgi:hypothetical protein
VTLPSASVFACRYNIKRCWKDAPADTLYFIVDDMDVVWTDGVPEIVDCQSIDIVAVV